jgi:hypothetical protein
MNIVYGRPRPTLARPGLGREAAQPRPIVQIRLYTTHTSLTGTLQLAFHRLSDHLNFGPPVLELAQAELTRDDHAMVHRAQQVAYIRRDSIILAIDRVSPEYAASHPALREAKEAVTVTADLGHFVVRGALHLAPGVDLGSWLLDGQLFVPLTDVSIFSQHETVVKEPFALINRGMLNAILH